MQTGTDSTPSPEITVHPSAGSGGCQHPVVKKIYFFLLLFLIRTYRNSACSPWQPAAVGKLKHSAADSPVTSAEHMAGMGVPTELTCSQSQFMSLQHHRAGLFLAPDGRRALLAFGGAHG